MKVLVEQTEFPELVRNVLADVGHRAIGTDDDLVVIVAFGVDAHHPAAAVLSLGFKENRVPGLELFKRMVPELQMQDVALAWEQIVSHSYAAHCRQMAADDSHGHQLRHFGSLVAALFDLLH